MSWEEKKICVLVKAYPERSKSYGSVICMAGITENGDWIRIYPVDFDFFVRRMKFGKFTWISAEVQKTSEKLMRKESYKIRKESIKIIDDSLAKIPQSKSKAQITWKKRKEIVLPFLNSSVEELQEKYKGDKTSLGIIKPILTKLNFRKPADEIEIKKEKGRQLTIDGETVAVADIIEHKISYKFRCDSSACNNHDMTCEDWELLESLRSWKTVYDSAVLETKIKQRFFDWMKERDLYFYMGTESQWGKWLIIGLFYPPKE